MSRTTAAPIRFTGRMTVSPAPPMIPTVLSDGPGNNQSGMIEQPCNSIMSCARAVYHRSAEREALLCRREPALLTATTDPDGVLIFWDSVVILEQTLVLRDLRQ